MLIYGFHAVREALGAGRVTALQVSNRADAHVGELLRLAKAQGLAIRDVRSEELDRSTRGGVHQGVAAEIRRPAAVTIEELVRDVDGVPLLVVLDGVEDPQNVGAILRTVDAAGAHGVVRQSRHAAALAGGAAKASAGALAYVPIAEVVNIARTVDALKELRVWTVGLTADADQRYDELDLTLPTAFVLGAEGSGLRRLVRERCDVLAAIPMAGHVQSVNVSVAAGIVLFEAARQRRGQGHPQGRTREDAPSVQGVRGSRR